MGFACCAGKCLVADNFMPLSKSQASRNKRIIGQSIGYSVNRVVEHVSEGYYRNVYCAWYVGAGCLAGTLVRDIECIKNLWGKGDERKVMPLVQICACAMMSIWFRYLEKPRAIPEKVLFQGKENAIYNILNLADSWSEGNARDITNLDIQFNYEQDLLERRKDTGKQGISTWYASLLLVRIKEAWGFKKILDWDKQVFPIKESSDYRFMGQASYADIYDFTRFGMKDILALSSYLIPEAGTAMFDYFDTLNK